MKTASLDSLIQLVENYTECWKQLSHYFQLARSKKFEADDETQFLEVKSVLAQQLEIVLATLHCQYPTRDEVHKLLSDTPSLRYLSEIGEDLQRSVESRWHRIYIGWQAILGQMKVRQLAKPRAGGGFFALFRRAA